jgi:predicted secreted hydrolase
MLASTDVALAVLDEWTSGTTGVRYPVAWRLVLPREAISLEIRPYLEQQELDLSVRYWEGAVRAEGRGPMGGLTGQGYLELAGY